MAGSAVAGKTQHCSLLQSLAVPATASKSYWGLDGVPLFHKCSKSYPAGASAISRLASANPDAAQTSMLTYKKALVLVVSKLKLIARSLTFMKYILGIESPRRDFVGEICSSSNV